MASLGQILSRTFFWSYERMTWQYDVAVALILIFVFFTPRAWFHDQPRVGVPANSERVQRISPPGTAETYEVDTRVLAPPVQTPLLANELHNVLQRNQRELSDGRFSIVQIEPVRDDQGTVIAYRVEIHR
jgi:hypothetical protein